MKSKSQVDPESQSRRLPPANNPDAREAQMISLAVDLAEKQLREGTASSQVITHFLKLASSTERLEKELKEKQKELLEAKTESLQSNARLEELYTGAIQAMRDYGGFINGGNDS